MGKNLEYKVTWTEFKDAVTLRGFTPNYSSNEVSYQIYGLDNYIFYACELLLNSDDAIDFETNYKSIWKKI